MNTLHEEKCHSNAAYVIQALHKRDKWTGPITSVHKGKKPFKCNICDASFTRKGSLNIHMGSVHEGKKLFKCSICDTGFVEKSKLNDYIATNENIPKL